jgi:sulfotransferase family protein
VTHVEDENGEVTVVYISGYNRSGSTILGILLGQHPDAVTLGEMHILHERLLMNEGRCACELPPTECGFWKEIYERCFDVQAYADRPTPELQGSVESVWQFPWLALRLKSKRRLRRYGEQMELFFKTVAEVAGKRCVIDLSKGARRCAGRSLALSRYTNLNVKTIHLVRDGRGCVWSYMKQQGGPEDNRRKFSPLFNFIHTVAGWAVTHTLALLTSWLLPKKKVLRVRYEDLCESPRETLTQIGEFIGFDIGLVLEKMESQEELEVGHIYGGNPTRFTEGLQFRPDRAWHDKLPKSYQRAFILSVWPLARVLGYK